MIQDPALAPEADLEAQARSLVDEWKLRQAATQIVDAWKQRGGAEPAAAPAEEVTSGWAERFGLGAAETFLGAPGAAVEGLGVLFGSEGMQEAGKAIQPEFMSPAERDTTAANLGSVLGSGASFMIPGGAAGVGAKALGAGAKLATAARAGTVATQATLSAMPEAYYSAKANGATDEKAWWAALVSAGGQGALEIFGPQGKLLDKVADAFAFANKATGGAGKAILASTLQEAVEEPIQSVWGDTVAQRLFDVAPDEPWGEILGKAAATIPYGAFGGAVLGGAAVAASRLGGRKDTPEPGTQEDAPQPVYSPLERDATPEEEQALERWKADRKATRAEFVERPEAEEAVALARKTGATVLFVDDDAAGDAAIEGMEVGRNLIILPAKADPATALLATATHESVHTLPGGPRAKLVDDLTAVFPKEAKALAERYKARAADAGKKVGGETLKEESAADLAKALAPVVRRVMTDRATAVRVMGQRPGLMIRVLDTVRGAFGATKIADRMQKELDTLAEVRDEIAAGIEPRKRIAAAIRIVKAYDGIKAEMSVPIRIRQKQEAAKQAQNAERGLMVVPQADQPAKPSKATMKGDKTAGLNAQVADENAPYRPGAVQLGDTKKVADELRKMEIPELQAKAKEAQENQDYEERVALSEAQFSPAEQKAYKAARSAARSAQRSLDMARTEREVADARENVLFASKRLAKYESRLTTQQRERLRSTPDPEVYERAIEAKKSGLEVKYGDLPEGSAREQELLDEEQRGLERAVPSVRYSLASPRVRRSINELVRDAEAQSSWKTWYDRHQKVLVDLFGTDSDLFQKILSATSQATGVKGNVSLALKAYDQFKTGEPFTGYLPAVIKNLERIRSDRALQGAKISQYGEANAGNEEAIAVDRHIAMLFFRTKSPNRAQIEKAKQRIRTVADRLGWRPREVQAALWAANQVRLGTDPKQVQSYDILLQERADQIRELRSRFSDSGGTGESDGTRGEAARGDEEGPLARYSLASEAGAAPDEVAAARKAWKEQGTESPWFKRWFGDSKVVDGEGKPLVVYHGTNDDFTVFDREKSQDFWFSSDPAKIARGESGAAGTKALMPVYLSVQKLAGWKEYESMTTDQLIAAGYDGIKLDNDYVVFEPTQIKSATGNRGTFDPENPDIRYSLASKESEDAYIKRITGKDGRIPSEARPNLSMGDMYGMAPKNGRTVSTKTDPVLGTIRFLEKDGNVYALATNPDLGEIDVVGYSIQRGDGTELAVVQEAQGRGIGEELSYQYRKLNPYAPSGGMTEAGERTVRKAYRRLAAEGVIQPDARYSIRSDIEKEVQKVAQGLGREGYQLANAGTTLPERGLRAAVRSMMAPEYVPDTETEARVQRILNDQQARSDVLAAGISGEPLNTEQTVALDRMAKAQAASAWSAGSEEDMGMAQATEVAFQQQRTEQARTMGTGLLRDSMQTPMERAMKLLLTPSRKVQRKLAKAETWQARRAILREEAKKVMEVRYALAERGFDPRLITDDYFKDPEFRSTWARAVADAKGGSPADWYISWRRASMLSAPITAIRNLSGNTAYTAYDRVLRLAADSIVPKSKTETGDVAEYVKVLLATFPEAWSNARDAYRDFYVKGTEGTSLDDKANLQGGKIRTAVEGVGIRVNVGTDAFFKTILGAAEIRLRSRQMARAKGGVAEDYEHDPDVLKLAKADMERALFLDRDKLTRGIVFIRDWADENFGGIPVGSTIVPFASTPTQLVRRSGEALLGPAAMLWRKEEKRGTALLGAATWAAMIWAASLFDDDDGMPLLTGSRDWGGEGEFQGRTAPAYSMRIGDSYYSYQQIQPLSTALAAIVDGYRKGTPMESIGSFVKAAKDQSFFRSIEIVWDAVQGVAQGERGLNRAGQVARDLLWTPMIPNVIRAPVRAADEVRRKELGDPLEQRDFAYAALPIAALGPPLKHDLWGRPVQKEGGSWVARVFGAMPMTQAVEHVERVDALLGKYYSTQEKPSYFDAPETYVTRNKQRIDWTEEEYSALTREAGTRALERIRPWVAEKDTLTKGEVEYIGKVISATRAQVANELLQARNPE